MNDSKRRREENEVVFRLRNNGLKSAVDTLLPEENKDDFNLGFTCECSDENCKETVEISAATYEHIRQNPREFILKTGHQQPDIERVVHNDGYIVVEKFDKPPPTDGRLNHTY
jgi:hypothetical protein